MENKNITMEKYKKQLAIFRSIGLICVLAIGIYLIVTLLNRDSFDRKTIIACSLFGGAIVALIVFMTIFDVKRKNIIKKHYGTVCEADQERAKALLEKMYIVDRNEYDFFDMLECDTDDVIDLIASRVLKRLAKGEKIYIGLCEPIKMIKQEIKSHKDKYKDEEFNDFIFELVSLLENNVCDI